MKQSYSSLYLFTNNKSSSFSCIRKETSAHHNMGDYRIIEEFQFPTDTLIQEWAIYCGLNESVGEFKI